MTRMTERLFASHEANYSMEMRLKGARAQENRIASCQHRLSGRACSPARPLPAIPDQLSSPSSTTLIHAYMPSMK